MFELKNQNVKIQHINVRTEKIGPEKMLVADLKINVKETNDVLSEFDPLLKSALYERDLARQGELIDDPNHLPNLKFPKMGSISWDSEFSDYDLTLHLGIGGKSDIKLADCKVDRFRFEPQDGGTVDLTFRATIKPLSAQIGRICDFLEKDVEITLLHDPKPEPTQKEFE
jgi:hypothetical protein